MKIIFNDLSELEIQAYSETGGKLNIRTISAKPDALREMIGDVTKTRKMTIDGKPYEGYTEWKENE